MHSHVTMWSDGSPNQFKYTYPVWFLSRFKKRFGFKKVWWNFYASCHGKGMQDAAGAWVKTRVAKAILLGGDIKSVGTSLIIALHSLPRNQIFRLTC